MEQPGPMVLFATPGMLHAGLSLQVFCSWAPDPNNMVGWSTAPALPFLPLAIGLFIVLEGGLL